MHSKTLSCLHRESEIKGRLSLFTSTCTNNASTLIEPSWTLKQHSPVVRREKPQYVDKLVAVGFQSPSSNRCFSMTFTATPVLAMHFTITPLIVKS